MNRRGALWLSVGTAIVVGLMVVITNLPDSSDRRRGGNERTISDVVPAEIERASQESRRLTLEEITTTRSGGRLLSRVYFRLLARTKYEYDERAMEALHPDAIAVLMITEFEDDSYNGGIVQYVMNHGEDAEADLTRVAEGYRTLGLTSAAELASDALAIARQEHDRRSRISRQYRGKWALIEYQPVTKLNSLDHRLEDTEPARIAYIRAHPESFVG